jgi:hypothetical protein
MVAKAMKNCLHILIGFLPEFLKSWPCSQISQYYIKGENVCFNHLPISLHNEIAKGV